MIIIEGVDGSGKTSLANYLHDTMGFPVVHSPGPKEHWLTAVMNFHAARPNHIVIYDRFYFSEFVYGPILRGGVAIPKYLQDLMEQIWLPVVKPLVIFCDVPDTVLEWTVQTNSQMDGVRANLKDLAYGYRELFKEFIGTKVVKHDFTRGSLLDTAAEVEHWLDVREVGEHYPRTITGGFPRGHRRQA